MTAQIPIQVNNLSFRYRSREEVAIRDINLTVQAGEMLLIAGASGCGKTTLARCINGLIPRSYKGELSGQILMQGQNIASLPLSRISQMVGTVLQDPERQILGSIVLNEVAFGLENLGLSREEIRSRTLKALEYLGIYSLRDRETFSLSGGEKQKVALAGVLAMRPSILMLDEPLASLDPASAQETLALVRRLADEGMTVLMVEHRVEDVLAIRPDRILFLMNGQMRYLGPTAGLKDAVDYHEVKLPTAMVISKAASQPASTAIHPYLQPAADAHPLVEFQDVSFGYGGEVQVLSNINLTINRRDVIAVLGPNGAGKTTLVKHAIGLCKPTGGHVLVEGRDTRELSVAQIANTLGYVFQSPSHMLFAPTVQAELEFGPKNIHHPPAEIAADVEKAIRIVNLQGMEQIPPLSMSFGQQKRVSIASILSMRSRILVMDEPTAGQDYKNYMGFMDSIVQMPGFESILFITHDIDMALIYANRVLVVNNGRIVADGTPFEALHDLERLKANRLVPSSLLQANLERYPVTGGFMRAEQLAHLEDC
jgi:energy-coupling factor transport system ATP-binding protein